MTCAATGAGWALDALDATVRVRASAPDGRPVFIGIAPKADVDRYLAAARMTEISDVPLPRSRTARSGAAARTPPAMPATQTSGRRPRAARARRR